MSEIAYLTHKATAGFRGKYYTLSYRSFSYRSTGGDARRLTSLASFIGTVGIVSTPSSVQTLRPRVSGSHWFLNRPRAEARAHGMLHTRRLLQATQ